MDPSDKYTQYSSISTAPTYLSESGLFRSASGFVTSLTASPQRFKYLSLHCRLRSAKRRPYFTHQLLISLHCNHTRESLARRHGCRIRTQKVDWCRSRRMDNPKFGDMLVKRSRFCRLQIGLRSTEGNDDEIELWVDDAGMVIETAESVVFVM